MRKWLLLIPVCLCTALLSAGITIYVLNDKKEKSFETEIGDARKYLEELNYEEAEASYRAALQIDPKEEEPYLRLAEIYTEKKEPEKAVEVLRTGTQNTDSREIQEKYSLYAYVDEVLIPQEGQCQEGEYVCEYLPGQNGRYTVGVDSVHSQKGVLTSRILDFDGDGQEELLVLTMENQGQTGDAQWTAYMAERNAVYLQMYELQDGAVVQTDEYQALYPVLGYGDYENSGIFLNHTEDGIYLCGSTYNLIYMWADDSTYNSFVLRYNGSSFEKLAGTENTEAGSSFEDLRYPAYRMAEFLENTGLVNEAAQIRESYMRKFDFVDDTEDMLMQVTGDNDGTGDGLAFSESGDPEDLGQVVLTLKLTWENDEESAASAGNGA